MTTREVRAVRASAAGVARYAYAVTARGGGATLAGVPPRPSGDRAAREYARLAALLPARARGTLTVETGWVRQRTGRADSERRYLVRACRGTLVGPLPRWVEGDVAADDALPVVAGPSAVLALVAHAVRVGGRVAAHLDAVDRPELAHPPHAVPAARPRTLVRRGRAGRAAEPPALLRPETWAAPYGALGAGVAVHLVVTSSVAAPRPARVLTLDSLVPYADGARRTRWRAEVSLHERGAPVAVLPPMLVELDAVDLLAGAVGATGGGARAVRDDPLTPWWFGTAPPLLLGLRAEALR